VRFILVGKGAGRGLAPLQPTEGCQIWGINNVGLEQYVDGIFDMHDLDWTEEECYENYDHLRGFFNENELREKAKERHAGFSKVRRFAAQTNLPLITVKEYEDLPSSIAYPLDEIIAEFDEDYFSSTVPYAIAYAIYQGYESVELFGISCMSTEEWGYQRECVAHWLGIAKGRGMRIGVTGEKYRLLRSHNLMLYGYNVPQKEKGIETEDGWLIPKGEIDPSQPISVDDHDYVIYKVWRES
jgi:hypothetical protein